MIDKYIEYIKFYTDLNPRNFLEIGSRDGLDADKIYRVFNNISSNKIYLVEPYPLHINEIKNNFPQYKIFECGLNLTKGKFKFYGINLPTREHSGLSSFLDREDDVYRQAINLNALEILSIDTITGKELLDKIGEEEIDLCDLDVEGMAYEVLVSFGETISKLKTIHLECEIIQLWKNQFKYSDVKQYLESKNFMEVYKQPIYNSQLDLIYVNKAYFKPNIPL